MRIFAGFVILVFLIPNAYALLVGHESYPFTPAPMFTQYIDEKTNFYDLIFVGQNGSQEVVLSPESQDNQTKVAQRRFFFDQVYGSADKNYPIGERQHDTKGAFESRMTRFFNVYFNYPEANKFKMIKLVARQYTSDYKETESHVVGIYDNTTKHFTHIWGKHL
jgi:uncharacterized protein YozE (UPF0346 family)